jgi:hypothetical protein
VFRLNKLTFTGKNDPKEIHYQKHGVQRIVQRKPLKLKSPIHSHLTQKEYYTKEKIF